ncbi:MAG: hypothetical protein CEE38_15955 [Planctomycetes bacterium B3_Pla]|nr:MAG: hypothetical protein CEE38_15955 [Planctomycetes bacterium B3_Pla]
MTFCKAFQQGISGSKAPQNGAFLPRHRGFSGVSLGIRSIKTLSFFLFFWLFRFERVKLGKIFRSGGGKPGASQLKLSPLNNRPFVKRALGWAQPDSYMQCVRPSDNGIMKK